MKRPFVVFAIALAILVSGISVFGVPASYADTNGILSTLDKLQFLGSVTQTLSSDAQTAKNELQKQIDARNQQLQQIQAQLDAAKKALGTTQTQRKSLQNEISGLQTNIQTLQLGIQKDQTSIEKLGFEIQGLNGDVHTLQEQMVNKTETIGVLMRELQKSDSSTPLITFLQAGSFSAGIQDANAVMLLQEKLTNDLADLRDMHAQVVTKIAQTGEKKDEIAQKQEDLKNQQLIVQDQKASKTVVLQQTKNQESVYQQQVATLQAQQKKIADEIEAIDAALRSQINSNVLPNTGHGVLGVPIEGGLGRITQGYGYTAFAKNGYQGQRHNGIDIGTPVGTPVYSAEAGSIVATGDQDTFCPRGAYGRFVVIKHTNGLVTLYGHLSRIIATPGAAVVRGQLIGYSGMTGYATGPHLHFTVYAGSTFYMGQSHVCGPMPYGGDVNPLNYL